jgi:hypothetical protein
MAFPKPIDGSKLPLDTKGDLIVFGKKNERLPVGTNGQVLTADSAQALGVKWAPPAGGGSSYIKYDPDEPPETANAKDDEFNDASIDAKWTWANQGTATAEEGGKAGLISITPANDSKYRCLTQAVPAGAWTLTAKVHFGGDFIDDSYAGIVILPATDGAVEALAIGKDGSSATNLRAEKWTNWSTFDSQRKLTYWNATVCYLKIAWNGTNLTYSISSTGVAYAKLLNAFAPSFTPGRIGIAARGNALPSYFDWFRVA